MVSNTFRRQKNDFTVVKMNCNFFMFGKGEEWANLGGFVEDFMSASHWGRRTKKDRNSWVNPVTC